MLDPIHKSPSMPYGSGNHVPDKVALRGTLNSQPPPPPYSLTRVAQADSSRHKVPVDSFGRPNQATSVDRRTNISHTSPTTSPSLNVRIPVTPSATHVSPSDHPSADLPSVQVVENEFSAFPLSPLSPQVSLIESEFNKNRAQFAKVQRTLGENVPVSLIFRSHKGITASVGGPLTRRDSCTGTRNVSNVLDVSTASQEEMPVVNDDRSSPSPHSLSSKQKLLQVKRALKMEQVCVISQLAAEILIELTTFTASKMFGELPPSSLYRNNSISLAFGADAGGDLEDDEWAPVPPPEDDFDFESDPADPPGCTIGVDDEDIASGFGKMRTLPKNPSLREEASVQSAYPYISTLSGAIPESAIKDKPFQHYASHSTLPIVPPQRSSSLRPVLPLPKAPRSAHSFHLDRVIEEELPSFTQRGPTPNEVDNFMERPRPHSSRSCRGPSSSTIISDDRSFQTRRKRAAKLARFFGVKFNDLNMIGTSPLAPPDNEEPSCSSTSTTSSSSSRAVLSGVQHSDDNAPSIPLLSNNPPRHWIGSRPSTPFELSTIAVIENKFVKEKSTKGVRIINPRDNPEDVGEVLVRLRAMR